MWFLSRSSQGVEKPQKSLICSFQLHREFLVWFFQKGWVVLGDRPCRKWPISLSLRFEATVVKFLCPKCRRWCVFYVQIIQILSKASQPIYMCHFGAQSHAIWWRVTGSVTILLLHNWLPDLYSCFLMVWLLPVSPYGLKITFEYEWVIV